MTGDGVMALFGAPIALEDAPQRALWSALSIHREMEAFNETRENVDPIRMRIGVHTGPVIVGTLGNDLRVEFKAVGDTVNLASRMEGMAEAGSTYVTGDTFRLARELFRFEALGDREVKGKVSMVPVYKLLSAKESIHRPRLGLERSIYSEMVGRDKELNQLELQVLKTVNGEGSIVNVIGEAGIGKSRLIAELKNCDVIKKVSLFEGRAISTGRNLSFHPVIDFLKHWARIGEEDSGAAALGKLEEAVRRVAADDIHEMLPFVATLMGMKLSGRYAERVKGIEGEALEKLILKNMRELLIKASGISPLVIVMEDLHWADTSSIELMESLFRLAETQRILFVNVFRPGHKETGDRVVETIKERYSSHYVEIYLQALDVRMSEMLISNMLQIKGLKHAFIDRIVTRADGNPFFIEEVVRSFIDQGAIVAKDGAFEVTEKIDRMVIPDTIHDVLMARIDRLEEKTRDLVKIASVIGRGFFYRILKEMTKTIEDIDDRLTYLKEIQLIRGRMRMDELEYLFKHALAQEAAYESILLQRRKDLHLKVADSIERVFKERLHEFYGMLAYHYSNGEDLDKAEEYMIKAGEEAMGSSASHEALRYYQEALRLYLSKYGGTADPEKLAMFEKNIASALFNKGEFEDAMDYFDRALRRWGVQPPKNRILMMTKALFDLSVVILKLSFPSKKSRQVPIQRDRDIFNLSRKKCMALGILNPMRMVAEVAGDINRILKFDLGSIESGYDSLLSGVGIFAATGLSYRLSNRFLKYGERSIDKNNSRELFQFTFHRDIHNYYSGKWDEIQDYDESMVDKNLREGLFWEISYFLFIHSELRIYKGAFNDLHPLLKKLSKIYNDYEYKQARQYQLLIESMLFTHQRALNDARKAIEEYELLYKTGPDMMAIGLLGLKAMFQILINDFDAAEKSLRQAEDISREQAIVHHFIAHHCLFSRTCLSIRLFEESMGPGKESVISKYRKQASKRGKKLLQNSRKYAPGRPGSLYMVGCYYWLAGKQSKAIIWWKKAIEEGKRLGSRPDLARTYMEIGKRFLEGNSKYNELSGITASEYLEKARTMFQEMDLQWDLDELDKITTSL